MKRKNKQIIYQTLSSFQKKTIVPFVPLLHQTVLSQLNSKHYCQQANDTIIVIYKNSTLQDFVEFPLNNPGGLCMCMDNYAQNKLCHSHAEMLY